VSTPTRVVAYVRQSQDRSGEGLSVERQMDEIGKHLADLGWPQPTDVISDNDRSATKGARPGFERLMAGLRGGEWDAVAVRHVDRLYRRLTDLEPLVDALDQAHAQVAVVHGSRIDVGSASGRMVARILGSVAQHETEVKAERQQAAIEQRAKRGKPPMGGARPFGYRNHSRQELVPAEADAIRQAAADLLARRVGIAAITRRWNEEGIRTSTGAPWHPTTVRRLLTSPTLAGLSTRKGEIVGTGEWMPILDEQTHRQIVRLVQSRPQAPAISYLLSGGLIRCGRCGEPMAGAISRGARWYRCSKSATRPDACGSVIIRAEPTDEFVVAAVRDAIGKPGVARRLAARAARSAPAAAKAQADLDRLDVAASETARRIREGLLTPSQGDNELREIQRDRVAAERRLAAASPDRAVSPEAVRATLDAWEDAPVLQRRASLAALIDRIDVAPVESGGGPVTRPDRRLSITWSA
jgi:DNA invertase Pin-like site-specific DNA recombinase